MQLIGGTAFWVITAFLLAGYLAPLRHYVDGDIQRLAFADAEISQRCPE